MNREDRAKQFAPFEALTGLREALREKEIKHDRENRKEITEEKTLSITKVILSLEKGDKVKIDCFESGYYITVIDKINKIDLINKFIVVGEGKVFFDDIYEIEKL